MTMPHLMNCSHSFDGWCLSCVKELHDETERIRTLWNDALPVLYAAGEFCAGRISDQEFCQTLRETEDCHENG